MHLIEASTIVQNAHNNYTAIFWFVVSYIIIIIIGVALVLYLLIG